MPLRRPVLAGSLPVMLLLLTLLSGCYSLAQPSFRPGDARDVLMALERRGVDVRSSIAGGSACADPSLQGNALHLVVVTTNDPTPRDIFVYTFRVRSWEESQVAVDACQTEYAAANPGVPVSRVDVPTYRVLGAGWSPTLESAIRAALEEAARQGE